MTTAASREYSLRLEASLTTLSEEVAQLRDLFQRRLLEDKAKNRLYDELYGQLSEARGKALEQALIPLFRELLLVVDRVNTLSADGDIILESVSDELLELLERRDVHRVHRVNSFDPSIHEAVRTARAEGEQPGAVLEVVRPGFRFGAQLLRPERVVVAAKQDQDPAPEANENT